MRTRFLDESLFIRKVSSVEDILSAMETKVNKRNRYTRDTLESLRDILSNMEIPKVVMKDYWFVVSGVLRIPPNRSIVRQMTGLYGTDRSGVLDLWDSISTEVYPDEKNNIKALQRMADIGLNLMSRCSSETGVYSMFDRMRKGQTDWMECPIPFK